MEIRVQQEVPTADLSTVGMPTRSGEGVGRIVPRVRGDRRCVVMVVLLGVFVPGTHNEQVIVGGIYNQFSGVVVLGGGPELSTPHEVPVSGHFDHI